jgi:hypothetical protein
MKIYDKGHFQTPLRFAGVFTVEGPKLDSLLRTLEPPSHNAWEPERGEHPTEAKKLLNNLKAWINEKVRQLVAVENVAEVDAEGISQYLPDELEDATKGAPQELESLHEEPAPNLDMRIRSTPSNIIPSYEATEGPNAEGGEEDGSPNDTEPTGEGGVLGNGGGAGTQNGDAPSGDGSADHSKRVGLANLRIYCSDPNAGRYRLLFEPQSAEAQHLRIFVIGEVGTEPAQIIKYAVNGGPEIEQSSGKGLIGPVTLPEGERAILDVVLKDSLRCALGVTAYAG